MWISGRRYQVLIDEPDVRPLLLRIVFGGNKSGFALSVLSEVIAVSDLDLAWHGKIPAAGWQHFRVAVCVRRIIWHRISTVCAEA